MASTNPVPTKVAQHAIRGLLFTTSCSVVLLAEERRRRIKIARTALENARKIHTAKSHRSAVALGGENLGTWEYRLNEDQEIVKVPNRRRRQSVGHPETRKLKGRSSDTDLPATTKSSIEPMLRAASQAVLQEAIGLGSLSLLNSPSTRPMPDTSDTSISRNVTIAPLSDKPTDIQKATDLQAKLQALAIDLRHETTADPKLAAPDTINNARLYLLATSNTDNISSAPASKDGVAILSQLVAGLCNRDSSQEVSRDRFDLALGVLQRLTSSGVPRAVAEVQLLPICSAFLQQAVVTNRDKLVTILDSLANIFKHMKMLYPFMAWLRSGGHNESIESLLAFLAGPNSPADWSCGQFLVRYFEREFATGENYSEMRNLYTDMNSAEYFTKFAITPKYECKLRAFVIRRAVEARDDEFAAAEIEWLRELFPLYLAKSLALQSAIVLQLARVGEWKSASAKVHSLAAAHGSASKGFRAMVSRATNAIAEKGAAEELDAWIEDLATSFGIHFNRRYAKKVSPAKVDDADAETFAHLRELANNEQWLQLCESYAGLWNQGRITSSRCIRLGVVGHLRADEGRTERAAALIGSAVTQGRDVTFAVTPLQLAQLEEGADAEELIASSLRCRVRLADSVYNKASQRLSAQGRWEEAINVCEVAARENGNGNILYNETNFSNLVYAYTGSMRYEPLAHVLDIFNANPASWHGSSICKESIKFAMKALAMRAVAADSPRDGRKHREALDKLDTALQHVVVCRREHANWRSAKKTTMRVSTPPIQAQSQYMPLYESSKKAAADADRWSWSSAQRVLLAEQG